MKTSILSLALGILLAGPARMARVTMAAYVGFILLEGDDE